MNAFRKLVALLLLSMFSITAFAITDNEVFAYAEAIFPSIFAGTATAGQYQQYNYRYYPASGNALGIDTSSVIYVLGTSTGNVLTTVGPVAAFANVIIAWQAGQAAASSYTLSVATFGTGSGTVASDPAGINCGSTCSASFNSGTSVTLTATPASGSTFAGWNGACTGSGTCAVSITAAKNVTASFNALQAGGGASALVGSWFQTEITSDGYHTETFIFNADGTYAYTMEVNVPPTIGSCLYAGGTYTATASTITAASALTTLTRTGSMTGLAGAACIPPALMMVLPPAPGLEWSVSGTILTLSAGGEAITLRR